MRSDGGFTRGGMRRGRGFWTGVLVGGILCGAVLFACGRVGDQREGKGAGQASRETGGKGDGPPDNLVLAHVGKQKITVGDLKAKIKLQFPDLLNLKGIPLVKQDYEILRLMFDQYCWVEAGERRGLDKDEEFKQAAALSRRFILADRAVKKLVHEKAAPSEQEIQTYYAENPDQFQIVALAEAWHILAPTRAAAEQIRRRALAGEDFSALARTLSTDAQTRDSGGSLGTVSYKSEIPGFGTGTGLNAQIMGLRTGEISEPIQTSRGWSLFKLTQRTEEHTQPLDEVKEMIRSRLLTKRANQIFSTTLAQVKQETGATIDNDGWQQYVFYNLSEPEIFQMAQAEGDAKSRIRLYQRLAEKFPRGQFAPQALFMAGFTYAEDLRDYRQSREAFQKMLKQYPQNELAASARWMMENMEKSLDNLPYIDSMKRKATGR